MNYQEARRLRNLPGLAEVMRQRALMGDSAGEAIRGALRDKYSPSVALKAKAMGIKEKFDPMNIVKFMTGGSKTAAALYGRFTGRSQEDIAYFAGRAKPVDPYTRIGRISESNDTLPILEKMYGFLHKIYEEDLKRKDKERDYAEERAAEDERRHREFLEALGLKERATSTVVKGEEGKGFLSTVSDMIRGAVNGLRRMIQSVVKTITDLTKVLQLGKLLGILRWFASPLGVALLGIATMALLANAISTWLTDFVRNQIPDFENTITQEDALSYLKTASERDINELSKGFREGRKGLEQKAVGGVENARMVLQSGDEEQIKKYGGRELLERVVAGAGQPAAEEKAPPRPKSYTEGLTSGAQQNWDRKYGGKFDPLTGKKLTEEEMVLPQQNIKPSQSPPVTAAQVPAAPAKIGQYNRVSGASTTPMQGVGPDVAGASALNRNLSMDQNMVQPTPNIDKSVEVRPRNNITDALRIMPPVRNMDDTFQRMIYNSIRVV